MFRDVPECSMFHVPGFVDAPNETQLAISCSNSSLHGASYIKKETLTNSVTEYICEKRLQRCNQMMSVQLNSISDKSVKRCYMSKFTFICQS